MKSRMTPAQLAAARHAADRASEIKQLVNLANGSSTRTRQDAARAELEQRYGKRKARSLIEDGLQSAGARPKGWRRLLG